MKTLALPKLYPITDARLAHDLQVERLCEGGARFIQLREKRRSAREFYREALNAVRAAHERGARLIVNDRADVALAVGADGVHLGQDDLSPDAARRVLGEGAIIGLSTHNVEQAFEAARMDVDYVAIGPVFATTSKEKPDPVVGLEGVRRAREAVKDKPLVAIGGVTLENALSVLEAGADSVALIGALASGDDPSEISERTRRFLSLLPD